MRASNKEQSTRSFTASIICLIIFCVPLLNAGCGKSPGQSLPEQPAQTATVEAGRHEAALAPGLYAVFDDKSLSVRSARIAPLQEQDLLALINTLRQIGGELAFGLIGESSTRPLLRLRIPVPPMQPVSRLAQNPFERAEQDAAFQEEMKSYEAKRQDWEAEVNRRVQAFMQAARPRLPEPAKGKATDIASALLRAELFLNEPSGSMADSSP